MTSDAHRSGPGFLRGLPLWTIIAPIAAGAVLTGAVFGLRGYYLGVIALALAGGVFAAVHHAEVIAHRVGEPYGTLVLASAVTLIEVALIVSLMIAGGTAAQALARDTVFAAVMIILNGIVGLSLLVGGLMYREQEFQLEGVSAALVALATITVLAFVFPNYTVTEPGPFYSPSQLALIAIVSLVVYGAFIFTQTVGHRQFFLQVDRPPAPAAEPAAPVAGIAAPSAGAAIPGVGVTAASAVLLLVSLTAVVLLAKQLAPSLEAVVARVGAPDGAVGVLIAGIILLPEGLAAVRAARQNHLQTSLNLALGSALASIGLTIPAVSLLSLCMNTKLMLGIDARSTVLLILSLFLTALVLRTGRTIVLHGITLLVVFAVYLFTTAVP
jgi:Ca2+:H+ antiporter